MGSLLSVIAMTVAANSPALVEDAVVKVRTERLPIVVVGGENDAVTPLARPLTLSATAVPARPAVVWNETAILVR